MASCFICVQPLDDSTPISSHSLSELLTTSCKLLEIEDISDEEWQLMESPNVTVCCSSCVGSLQRIKQFDDLLQRIQRRLKQCLWHVTTTVKNSSSKMSNVDVSKWSQGFFKFRSHFTVHHNRIPEITTTAEFYYDEDPLAVEDNNCDDPLEVEPSRKDQNCCNADLDMESKEIVKDFQNDPDPYDGESLSVGSFPDVVWAARRRRKRKIVVISEEDEDEPVSKVRVGEANEILIESRSSVGDDIQIPDEMPNETHSDEGDGEGPLEPKYKKDKLRRRQFNHRLMNHTATYSNPSQISKGIQKKVVDKKKEEKSEVIEQLVERQVFTPSNNPEMWFICGIDGCTSSQNYKCEWLRHARNAHPTALLKKVWREMPTREVAPRRLLHCGHTKCPMFDSRKLFNDHMKKFHTESCAPRTPQRVIPKNTLTCDMCRQPVPKAELFQHVRDHVGDYAIKCPNPKCVHAFCTTKYYKEHMLKSKRKRDQCSLFMRNGLNLNDCEVCGYHEAGPQDLRKHMEVVHEIGTSKPFSCPVSGCLESFSHRQTVLCHISFRHSRFRYLKHTEVSDIQVCPECSKLFPRDEILSHFTDFHRVAMDSIVSCQYCPYKSPTKEQLIDHFVVHFRAGLAVACDICTKEPIPRFSRLGSLRRHYIEVHQIGKAFICEFCSKNFPKRCRLNAHIRHLHSGNRKSTKVAKFTCDICVESDPVKYNQAGLIQHKILVHGAEPYKCPTCQKTFTSWDWFSRHKKEHKNVTEKMHPCDIPGCATICFSRVALARHKASIQHCGRTNAFVCEVCGTGFNTEKSRQNHQKQHATVKKFVCDVCGRGYVSQSVLATHARTHTGEKPFGCSICKNRYNDKSNLRRHMITKHPTVVKPT